MSNPTEHALIDAARAGDEAAFEALIHLYEKKVFALTRRLCPNPDDGLEAAQDAFLAAWQGLPSYRGEAGFSTWLYRLTTNACMDVLRREGRHAAAAGPSLDDEALNIDVPSPLETPQQAAERSELRRAIEAGLQTLPTEYRAALVLRELHQLSYGEIAQALDADLGTVKSRISRGRKLLRKYLLETGNFSPPGTSKETGREGRQ